MRHTLVYTQLIDKRTFQREIDVISIFLNRYNGSKLFYNSGKHITYRFSPYLQFLNSSILQFFNF